MRFGSLQKFAEIWSMCTNPVRNAKGEPQPLTHVLTSSEDQTCQVFRFEKSDEEKDGKPKIIFDKI